MMCEACDLGWPLEDRDGVWWHESPTGNVGWICRTRSPEAVPARSAASTYRRQAMSLREAALAGMPLFGTRRHGGIAAVEGLVDLVLALAAEIDRLRRAES